MTEPDWCPEARRLYHEDGLSTFKVASKLQRPSSSVWAALHPEVKHKWTAADRAAAVPLSNSRHFR